MICPNCGVEVEENVKECFVCGYRLDDNSNEGVHDNEYEDKSEGEEKRKKSLSTKLALITIMIIVAICILGYFVIYPKATDYLQNRENQKEAQKVINLIDSLKDEKITADSENELDIIEFEYNSLNKTQKKLVSNYSDLEDAYKKVEKEKARKKKSEETPVQEIQPDRKRSDTSNYAPGQTDRAYYSYIIPYSSTRILTYDDIKYFNAEELKLARNEIYARHGRMFNDPNIRAYFEEQLWYVGTISADDFKESLLSDIEKKNVRFIKSYE